MEQRGTCRTPLALNLHRKNKSDIARKNQEKSDHAEVTGHVSMPEGGK